MTSDAFPVARVSSVLFRYGGGRPGDAFTLSIDRFELARGERVAVVGPSGCGKTTLLRLLVGSLTPDEGEVDLLGARLSSMPDAARRRLRLRRVGMVFQDFALLGYVSALRNITLARTLAPELLSAREAVDRATSLARDAGIDGLLRRRPGRLSQGERQRVAICRALLTSPELIVCDEPTGNLDPERSRGVVDLLLREAGRLGAAVITVTHDPAVAQRFDRVVELDALVRRSAEAAA